MGLSRDRLFSMIDEPGLRTVCSAIPIDLASVVASDRPTRVFADEVLVGQVSTGGHDLLLMARLVTFQNAGVINTSGLDGTPSFPAEQRPEASATPGASGPDGADGGPGQNAGYLHLVAGRVSGAVNVLARGGAGGRGADGGHGRDGAPGVHAVNKTESRAPWPGEANGGAGGNAGAAGLPGHMGIGGKGGEVKFLTVEALDRASVTIAVDGGAAGGAAEPGHAGTPGIGGNGATFRQVLFCEGPRRRDRVFAALDALGPLAAPAVLPERHGQLLQTAVLLGAIQGFQGACEYQVTTGVKGNDGLPADPRSADVARRQLVPAPVAGSVDLRSTALALLADYFRGPILDLLACDIENQFRQEGIQVSAQLQERLAFLLGVCAAPAADAHQLEILSRAYAMARKVNLGLDYFGYAASYAPLLSFSSYSALIDKLVIPQMTLIENAFDMYWDANQTAEGKRAGARAAQKAGQDRALSLEVETDRVKNSAKGLLGELPALHSRVALSHAFLMRAEETLNDAIRALAPGCNMMDTLVAVATIVVGVASGGAGFVAAASAGASLMQHYDDTDGSFKQLWNSREVLGDDLTEIGKGAKDVVDGIGKIQEAYKKLTPEQRKLPQFRMERERFDAIAQEYLDLPEAAAYRDAGYDYLKAVETRNQAIVDYNAMLVQYVDMQAQTYAARRIVDGLASVVSGQVDPAAPLIVGMMSRLYQDTLNLAAQMVHAERKAMAYHFARPSEATLSAFNAATIINAHQRTVLVDWVSAKERYRARRELAPGQLTIEIRDVVGDEEWTAFKATGMLAVSFRRDHPHYQAILESLPGLRITGVEIVLDGAEVAAGHTQIPWLLTQGGTEQIYDSAGASVTFSHRPIRFNGFTSLDGRPSLIKPDFSEDNLYAGVSPFASWFLALSNNTFLALELDQLHAASFVFSGYMVQG